MREGKLKKFSQTDIKKKSLCVCVKGIFVILNFSFSSL